MVKRRNTINAFTPKAAATGAGEPFIAPSRLPESAKDSAATAVPVVVPTVARSVGDGEIRPSEFAGDGGHDRIQSRSVFWWSWAVMAQSGVPR